MKTVTRVALALTLALCVGQALADLPGCNEDTITRIAEYWNENDAPRGVMARLAKDGPGTLLYSTEVVPLKISVEKPKCVKGEFTTDTAKFTVVPRTGTLDAAKATVVYKVKEKNGVVYEGDVRKYIIFNSFGCTGWYSCNSKGGDPNAEPTAGLAVALKKKKTAKKFIAGAKSVLEGLGFNLQTVYGKECTN